MKIDDGVTAIGRNTDALAAFYREHIEAVQRFVARRVSSPEDAADITESGAFVGWVDLNVTAGQVRPCETILDSVD